MQQPAVIPHYGYSGPTQGFAGGASVGDAYGSMTKRRRIHVDDSGGDSSGAETFGGWDEPQEQHQAPTRQFLPAFTSGTASIEYAGASHDPTAVQPALHESSDSHALAPNAQWSSGASPYPDVLSYQQPYFYQQTDPSIYTSPWPPTPDSGLHAATGNYSVVQQSGSMPLFAPSHSPAEQSDGFDASTAAYHSYREPEVSSPYDYPTSQPHNEPPRSASGFHFEDASMHLKIQSLSILANLATQVIHTIAKVSFAQIQDLMRCNDAEESQAYITLKNLFDQTRKVYSREIPFIDAIAIQMFQPSQQEIIRKANIATFVSSILGAHDVSFFHLNEFFMETFVPLGHRLLKWQGAIYLELKTQTYISALMNSDGSPESMLDKLFPPDLDAQILTRHPDAPSLSPSEQDFVDRSRARKSYLLAEPSTEQALRALPKKYQWNDFVREFALCISKNVDGIMNVPARAQPVFGGGHGDKRAANALQSVQDSLIGQQAAAARNGQSGHGSVVGALNGAGVSTLPSLPQQGTSLEKRASASIPMVRQPWTKPEGDALLEGLGKVNGPHWSQILALYGRGGSVSEVLKDRNQVQLKDKARNLKLWYLKMGKDVPVALRGVTGELRKRGGARARAALGLQDEEQEGGADADADGEEGVGENIDPSLESAQGTRTGKKKKGARK